MTDRWEHEARFDDSRVDPRYDREDDELFCREREAKLEPKRPA